MREHKYRAWDIERKEMFTPMILNWIPSGIPIGNPIQLWHQRSQVSDDGFYVDNFILLQFTGLKDRNRKEIYDGDIVEYAIGNNKEKGIVSFYKGSWCVDGIQIYNPYIELEIIGNTYENPESLKESK